MILTQRRQSRPSPADYRQKSASKNDGTMSQEPYMRIMQNKFETMLRRKCLGSPNITMLIGTFDTLQESEDEVLSKIAFAGNAEHTTVHSKYVVGCDGAKSQVRQTIGVGLHGEQLPVKFFLLHFRSGDLSRLHCQGSFWHVFYTHGGIMISQDEIDTWTVHHPFPLDADPSTVDPKEVVFSVLGGSLGPYTIHVDEILNAGFWRPGTYTADGYRSPKGRVFLAGDSAHQMIPTGGYGMNTGVCDGFDISWKIAAVLRGFGGEVLLRSYEIERRPVGLRNVARSLSLMQVHLKYVNWVQTAEKGCLLNANSEESRLLRAKIVKHVETNDTEIREDGMELDYRHKDSPVIVSDILSTTEEPAWNLLQYTPSTLPGHRAPYIILSDGFTSTADLYGRWYTIVDFSRNGDTAKLFSDIASRLNIPLKPVHLDSEVYTYEIWGSKAVLIRPDGYVAWRSPPTAMHVDDTIVQTALLTAVGCQSSM